MTALQTDPSGGAPVGFRKKVPGLDAEPNKHAAGILFVAPDGDVLLLRRSSAEANYAGHWALPGGGVEAGETPGQGALREVREETGMTLDEAGLRPLDRRMTPTGSAFHTFARKVPEKFVPKLNGEHSGYAWAPLNQLPGPMHPAVAETLRDQIGVGENMDPEDWEGLRDDFMDWAGEEGGEGGEGGGFDASIATDSAVRFALDRDSVRKPDADGRMHVDVANISKATVNPYKGSEIPDAEALGLDPERIYYLFRDPAELEKAAATFNGVQILRKHIPVSADDHQPWDVVGSTGTDAAFDAPFLKNSLHVWARDAIADIESDRKKELSCGYRYKADMTPGEFDGMRYDGVMRDIVGNHVALVEDGRAGSDVVVGDSNEGINAMSNRELAQKIAALAARTGTFGSLRMYLKPRLALDAKIDLAPAFAGVTGKNFKEKAPGIATALRAQAKGKMAKDANLNDVEKVLDMLEKHEVASPAADEPLSEAEMKTVDAATLDIPAAAMPVTTSDNSEEGLRGFLKNKGMGEDDINEACGMIKKPATDEDPEEKKKREQEEADKKKAADESAKKDDDEKKAKDAAMKDMVTKPAMDAAITAATEATAKRVRESERGIRVALDDVRPYVGELAASLAFDSGEDVHRHALKMLKVPGAETIHGSALKTILEMQPKIGATAPLHRRDDTLGMDSAAVDTVNKMFPGIERIGAA